MNFGNYHIIEKVGKGGNGIVYKATHIVTGQVVALKILDAGLDIRRLKNEVRLHAGLRHPSIVSLLDMVSDKGKHALVLEFVEGKNLDEYLASHRLSLEEKRDLFIRILDPVEFLHKKNIIHRDLKFDNIKVMRNGQVKLLDFGISLGISSPKLTKIGFFVGTVNYTAPERIDGVNKKQSDIWSLGAIYYEMLTGERLLKDSKDIKTNLRLVRNEKKFFSRFDNLNDIDRKVLKKCLRYDYKKRYGSIGELKNDFLSGPKTFKTPTLEINTGFSKKWLLLPIAMLIFFLLRNDRHPLVPAGHDTCIELKFYPAEAVLKLDDGRILNGGDTICGKFGRSFNGELSAPGFRSKYIPVSFPTGKKFEQLYYTLKR